jgi:hypothetical protein
MTGTSVGPLQLEKHIFSKMSFIENTKPKAQIWNHQNPIP